VLANYKSAFLNRFFSQRGIKSVVDFGSGDGNQLTGLRIPRYTGVDVSSTAVESCRVRFEDKAGWQFVHDDGAQDLQLTADASLSLDVIYHLVEDTTFERYMRQLFKSATSHVIVYSSDWNEWVEARHVRHRSVTAWVARNVTGWDVIARPQNPYFFREYDDLNTTFAGFIVFGRRDDVDLASDAQGERTSSKAKRTRYAAAGKRRVRKAG